jgi:hypothetical protein
VVGSRPPFQHHAQSLTKQRQRIIENAGFHVVQPENHPQSVHTLRIVRVGPQAEAILDGRRLALACVPTGIRHVGFYMRVASSNLNILSLRADVLEPIDRKSGD